METDKHRGDPEKIFSELSGPDLGNGAVDKRIAAEFRTLEMSAESARDRVRAAVKAGAAPAKKLWRVTAAGAAALCGAAALMIIFFHPAKQTAPELSPDWRSDYNFPSYTGQAGSYTEELSPDWRSDYQFPGYQSRRDTSGR